MAEQLSRLPSRFRIPWITTKPPPTAPPANVDNQATSMPSTTPIPIPIRRFSFQLPESIPPSESPPEPLTPPETVPQNLSPSGTEPKLQGASKPESPSILEIKIQSTTEASKPPSPLSSEPPSPQETNQLETTPFEQALESQPTLQATTQPLLLSAEASQSQTTPQPPEPSSPQKQVPESQSNPQAIIQPPLPSDEENNQQPQSQTSSPLVEPPPASSRQVAKSELIPQAISQQTSASNEGADQTQRSPVRSLAPEPSQSDEGPELQAKPQVISETPSPSTVNSDQQQQSQTISPLPEPLIKDSLEQQSQTASSSPEPPFASEKGPESENTVQTISIQPAQSGDVSRHQKQSQTTFIPTGSLSPTRQALESPPTPQVISRSPSPPNNRLHRQQQSQTSLSVEPLSQSRLSASESETTSIETVHAKPALPKDQTEMQASSELEGVAKLPSQLSGPTAIDRDTSMKSREFITPLQPSSPSHTPNHLAREILSQPSPTSVQQLSTPTLSHPSPPSMQVSLLQTKSLPSPQISPSHEVSQPPQSIQTTSTSSSPRRSPTFQSEPLSSKVAQFQLPPSAILQQDHELKEQISPEQQVSKALDQTQIQATILSDGEKKEPSETRSPATTVDPTPTAAPMTHFPVQPPDSSSASVILNDPTKSKEINEGNQKKEAESKTEDRLARPTCEEPEKRMMTKLLNSASESNKHAAGHSVTTSKAELKQLEKQSTRNRSEKAATGFQGRKGRVALRTHPKKKIAGSRSQPRSSASQRELVSLNKEIREDFLRFAHKLAQGHSHQSMDENALSVIALCGVNNGASMHMVPVQEKEGLSDIVGGYQLNQGRLDVEVNTEEESSQEPIRFNDTCTTEDQASKAYINNNVQGINNSVLYMSSLQERNPGVHLVFSSEPKESAILNTKLESIEASQKQCCKSTVEKESFNNLFKDISASGAEDSNA